VNALIGMSLPFEYSEKFGFVTVNPVNVGSGFKASVHVKLSKMNKDKIEAINGEMEVGVKEIGGGVFEISTMKTLGKSAVTSIGVLVAKTKELIAQEKE
jgi:creatine kinase/arginine kinase